jgi:hypothetical protein
MALKIGSKADKAMLTNVPGLYLLRVNVLRRNMIKPYLRAIILIP